nr:hypothetical protein [Escherichia coli]
MNEVKRKSMTKEEEDEEGEEDGCIRTMVQESCVGCLPWLTSISVEERVRSDICEGQHVESQFGGFPSQHWHR